MPKFFEEWLKSLPNEQAQAMWEYFYGSFTNCEDVIDCIAESHNELVVTLCGPPTADKKEVDPHA